MIILPALLLNISDKMIEIRLIFRLTTFKFYVLNTTVLEFAFTVK